MEEKKLKIDQSSHLSNEEIAEFVLVKRSSGGRVMRHAEQCPECKAKLAKHIQRIVLGRQNG